MILSRPQMLRAYLQGLKGQLRTLQTIDNSSGTMVVDANTVELVAQEVAEVERDFPGLLPQFRGQDFFSHDVGRGAYYKLTGLILYITRVVGRLEAATEEDQTTPVTEERTFSYVSDPALRAILSRDYGDVQRSYIAGSWKAAIILAGGAMEAILLDRVKNVESAARAASSAPKVADLNRWDLADLIKVAVEISIVGSGIDKLSHSVREYRNLVHPGVELRKGLTGGKEEARIAIEILNMLDRELRK